MLTYRQKCWAGRKKRFGDTSKITKTKAISRLSTKT